MNEFLPKLMMIESFLAAIIYLMNNDLNRMLYWLSAGCITLAVLNMD